MLTVAALRGGHGRYPALASRSVYMQLSGYSTDVTAATLRGSHRRYPARSSSVVGIVSSYFLGCVVRTLCCPVSTALRGGHGRYPA